MPERIEPFILLADDDEEDQDMLKAAMLRLAPRARIDSVFNGREVIENAAEVLEKLVHRPGYFLIPKVVWTGHHNKRDVSSLPPGLSSRPAE